MTTPTAARPAARPRHATTDTSHYDAGDLRHPQALARMRELLTRDGLALFHGARSRAAALRTAGMVMSVLPHPDADLDGITVIADRGVAAERPGAAGFSRHELNAHTDRSGIPAPPALLMTICIRPALAGGASRLTDGLAVYGELAATCPQALAAFTRPQSVLFGAKGSHLGAVFTAIPAAATTPARVQLRLRLDDLVSFAPDLLAHLPALQAAIARHTITIPLGAGQGYLLDNHRWLHAREGFTSTRKLYRVLGDPLPSLELHPGIPLANEITIGRPSRIDNSARPLGIASRVRRNRRNRKGRRSPTLSCGTEASLDEDPELLFVGRARDEPEEFWEGDRRKGEV